MCIIDFSVIYMKLPKDHAELKRDIILRSLAIMDERDFVIHELPQNELFS